MNDVEIIRHHGTIRAFAVDVVTVNGVEVNNAMVAELTRGEVVLRVPIRSLRIDYGDPPEDPE